MSVLSTLFNTLGKEGRKERKARRKKEKEEEEEVMVRVSVCSVNGVVG